MKIYTRTGDTGETALFGGGRVRKDHVRVEAYGDIDELNATIGLAAVPLEENGRRETLELLRLVQEDLFAIGAHLATPSASATQGAGAHLPELPEARIEQMEQYIDEIDATLAPLKNFILPGGSESAARLHFARTVCRRAERRVMSLMRESEVSPGVLVYLNRLSDLLFVLARAANSSVDRPDVPWNGRRTPKVAYGNSHLSKEI